MTTLLRPLPIRAPRLPFVATACALLVSSPLRAQSAPAWAPVLDSVVDAALAASRAPGTTVAVVSNGRLVYARGYGLADAHAKVPMSADMLLRVGSVSKMFAGATLASLVESGLLDMSKPISAYVPSLAGRKVGTVTTQQLMTHNAGWLDNAVAYGSQDEAGLADVMKAVSDSMFFTEAGRTFSYSNPSISMAGYLAEVAGNERFATLAEQRVLRPAGMERSTFRPLAALTYPTAMGHLVANATTGPVVVRPMTNNTAQWAAGFLFSSAPELARFTMMLMNDGQLDGKTVLPASAVHRMTTGYVPHPGGSGLDSAMYGYGLVTGFARVNGTRERVWTHGGAINGYNAQVTMVPGRKASVIILVNGPGSGIAAIERKALELALGAPLELKARGAPHPLTAAERAALVGRYAMRQIGFELFERGDSLFLKQGATISPVQGGGNGELIVNGTQTSFYRLENGKAAYVYTGSRAFARQP